MKIKKTIMRLLLIVLIFIVEANGKNINYEKLGNYAPQVYKSIGKNENTNSDYVCYYPKGGVHPDMPVVIFVEGGGANLSSYRGIMKFLASKGYYVLSVDTGSYESWYVTKYLKLALDEIIKKYKLKIPKLAVMGHSLGGGQAFYIMKHFLKEGYGHEGNLVLSIDGWFAFDMNEKDFSSLNINASFIQMNGVHGTGTDPRIHLKIWNLLKSAKRSFYTLSKNNHNYVAGGLNSILAKKDLLSIVGALTDDAFNNTTRGAEVIKKYQVSYQDIYDALRPISAYKYGDCKGIMYNAIPTLKTKDIDYCQVKPLD